MSVVFISSTSEDLGEYREAARDAVLRAELEPRMMEYFVATGGPPLSECLAKIAGADVVVVIVAHRYGWVPPDQEGDQHKSITWLECEHAASQGKQVLAFLVDESYRWDPERKESYRLAKAAEASTLTDELTAEVNQNVQRLKDFKAWLNARAVRATFTTPDNLEAQVGAALSAWKSGKTAPCPPERFAELAAHAKRSITAAAQAWLDAECDPFVVPSLSRQEMGREGHGMLDARPERTPLTDEQIDALTRGDLPADGNRVRIVGDSGMGKTALLHYCERQIASTDDRVPVRLDGLSGFDWRDDPDLLDAIAKRVLHAHLPGDATDEERRRWLDRLVRDGQAVFLLDALDQTDEHLNHAGLRGFLQSAGVSRCAVLMTLRPEVEGSAVFSDGNWETLRVDLFDESRQRQFLGDTADELLPKENEKWQDTESYLRKQNWMGLLPIPLLLKLLRALARASRENEEGVHLAALRSRHALYQQAVAHLIRKGLDSTEPTPHRGKLEDPGEVIEFLTEIGWETVFQGTGNFTAVLQGEPFSQLRRRRRDILPALRQVDVITRHSVLDEFGQAGLAWRHRSFSEYFAALQFVTIEPDQWKYVLQRHGRDPRWQWVFRFAICEAARRGEAARSVLHAMASDLVRYGNPFVVQDAIDQDAIQVPRYLEQLCRWLVHRDWGWTGRDYGEAWKDPEPPAFDERWVGILESLFERQYRDSRCLHAAWQLVRDRDEQWAVGIRERFLAEFPRMLEDEGCPEHGVAKQLIDGDSFVRCPPDPADDGQPFQMGSPESDSESFDWEKPQHEVIVTPFYLQQAPVLNMHFELFDPSHRFHRDQYSTEDDQPAIWVSWYMADLFCTWLGEGYRLPTEAEWEYAARAGTKTRYWWGDTFDKSKCHNTESSAEHTVPPDASRANPWGLVDILGNVLEWCQDGQRGYDGTTQQDPVGPRDTAAVRVFRGGGWAFDARYCRAAFRRAFEPRFRVDSLGFRVAAVPPGGAGSKKEEAEPGAQAEGVPD